MSITLSDGRGYLLHARSQRGTRALVVVLHQVDSGARRMEEISHFDQLADSAGFVVAYGQGIGGAWNAGGCCARTTADDVAYLRLLVRDAERKAAIDPHRVYVVGYSNGGMLAYRAVCEAPDVFAAAANISGALMPGVQCAHTVVHVLDIHGAGDTTVPLDGGISTSSVVAGVYFPAQATEIRRVGRGSVITLRTFDGTHKYEGWETAAVWNWLKTQRLASPRATT